jgi:hypothetical protein
VQNVVNCVVNRGGVVVKVWLETTTNPPTKNMPTFSTFFSFFSTIDAEPTLLHSPGHRSGLTLQASRSLLQRMVHTFYNSKAMQRRTPLA